MLKWVLILAGAVVVVLTAALAMLPWLLNTPAFQSYVGQAAARALARPITFTSLSISAFPLPAVKLRGLTVAEDPAFGRDPFLTVGEGTIRIRLRPLLSGRVELADLTLGQPRIELLEDRAGRWNWTSLGNPAASAAGAVRSSGRPRGVSPTAVLFSRVSVVNGTMRYRRLDGAGSGIQVEKLNLTVSQTSAGADLRLRGDAVLQPGDVGVTISDGSLNPAGARSFAEMALKATVAVELRDTAPLGQALAGIPAAGTLKGRLQVSGTPTRIVATGTMGLDRLMLTAERPQCEPKRRQLQISDIRLPVTYAGLTLDGEPLEARVARGSVRLHLGVDLSPARTATLRDITVKGVELEPILVDFACQPYALTGPLDLTGFASLRIDDPWRTANGSGRLRVGPGKVMGREVSAVINEVAGLAGVASAVLSPDRRLRPNSPLSFDSITATYTITNGVVGTKDLLYRASDMTLAAVGTVALLDGRVNMRVTLSQAPNQIKAAVTGTVGALTVVPTGIDVPDTRGIKKFLDTLLR
jgi:AsmA protein